MLQLLTFHFSIAYVAIASALLRKGQQEASHEATVQMTFAQKGISLSLLLFFIQYHFGKGLAILPIHLGGSPQLIAIIACTLVGTYVVARNYFSQIELQLKMMQTFGQSSLVEIGYRAGVVHFVTNFYGVTSGILGGVLPILIIGIIKKVKGKPITISSILLKSISSFILALLYLEYGLIVSLGCHWSALFLMEIFSRTRQTRSF